MCQEFNYDDVTYLIDTSTNKVYSTENGNAFVGKFQSDGIDFDAIDSDDASESEGGEDDDGDDGDTVLGMNGVYGVDHEPATVQL